MNINRAILRLTNKMFTHHRLITANLSDKLFTALFIFELKFGFTIKLPVSLQDANTLIPFQIVQFDIDTIGS